ncbi:hypothetical protein RSOLAG22IIIB_08521 [Rhizoctonia solani]|uniref:Uncharacterized protein n=1 Tax=Rhizoctonia solani TaxID=456999 RepID=A0A0K6FU21_9AGAM|nr:hypothetical protein RSOLAG22IIIB_08521 [Rhizoctonia solani]
MQRSEISIEEELAGLRALKEISAYSLETCSFVETNSNIHRNIDAPVLRSALRLAQDPVTIRHLSDPGLVPGCIKFLTTDRNRRTGMVSAFSEDFGWLCLKLLVIALNACLLERYKKLEETVALSNQRFDIRAAPHILVSTHLACGITAQLEMINSGGNCDWVFGWSTSPRYPRQKTMLPASEALDLMNVIWEDRKSVMNSLYLCTPTSRPNLCGLLFMFFRSLAHVGPQSNLDQVTLESRIYELGIRYLLVANKYERLPTLLICEASTRLSHTIWSGTPKHVDAEDSRTIMSAFIQQVTAGHDPDILRGKEPAMMLQLIPFSIHPDVQTLIPEVMRCTIHYGWTVLLEIYQRSNRIGGLVEVLFDCLRYREPERIMICPSQVQKYHLELSTQKQIIEVLYDQDLPDLTARIIIELDPLNPKLSKNVCMSIFEFFEELFDIVETKSDLEKRFRHYVPEWWRTITSIILNASKRGV